MRIVVFSDSHGNYYSLEDAVEANLSADMFIHLGDGQRELQRLEEKYPDKKFIHVRGNCDFASQSSLTEIIVIDEKNKILAVHGHNHGVRSGSVSLLKSLAMMNNANIVLFGHTHCRYQHYEDGIYFLNPGSISEPRDGKPASYGYIDIMPNGIMTNIVDLKK